MTSQTAEIFVFIPQQPQTTYSPQLGDKLDSQGESIFQAIGISYSILDMMIAHNASCANAAADFFATTLLTTSFTGLSCTANRSICDWLEMLQVVTSHRRCHQPTRI